MRLAEIVVDVPSMQTNQPYTYYLPTNLAVEIGMRVEVGFGRGDRHVQGFVVGLKDGPQDEKLKPIVRVLDLAPVLNTELLALADYMTEKTYAFKITCFQTMLPSVMKADYSKKIKATPTASLTTQHLLGPTGELSFEEAEQRHLMNELQQLRRQAEVEIVYEVTTRNKVKTERYITCVLSGEALQKERDLIRKGAQKQLLLLDTLGALRESAKLSVKKAKELGLSTAVLNQGAARGWLAFEEVEQYRDPFAKKAFQQTTALQLNPEQKRAAEAITASVNNQKSEVFLLEGITGSGKTEVYLQTIAAVLQKGQTAIMLVPEISLTPQMVERFKGRFGSDVAVLHSGLSQGEKYDEWRKIERHEAKVVVGARSAIFAPLDHLGLIIIDEEHETSYKQDETPRYNARDLAIWRGRYHHCPVVLGSATPSLESRARAQKKVYHLLTLSARANTQASLPSVEVVDLREELQRKNASSFSQLLQEKMRDRLQKGEQTVLMLNRRGYSSFIMCRDCGYVLPCPNCDISLTLHMDTKTMDCHYCGHKEKIPYRCPQCGQDKIRYYGTGTQKVEEELKQLLPKARILRMDVDTTRRKGAHEKILQQFGKREADILLGTQMIAKGLDFPNVTLVGVLNADTALNLPDFRSSERTFQLLTQVSGRAGRAEKPGEVVIQTFNPEHYAIQLAKTQDYEAFYQKEMQVRHMTDYPPYFYTIKITASHTEEMQAAKKMQQVARELEKVLSPQSVLLGPIPASITKIKNRYIYQVIIKYKREEKLTPYLEQLLNQSQREQRSGLLLSIDNEPQYFV